MFLLLAFNELKLMLALRTKSLRLGFGPQKRESARNPFTCGRFEGKFPALTTSQTGAS